MNFEKWKFSRLGKYIDYDNAYGVQCVDLFNDYIVNCIELKVGYFPEYAKDFWINRNNVNWLKNNFTFISFDEIKKGNVRKGDIGIRTSGYAGHIFICERIENNSIVILDQNHYGKNDPCTNHSIIISKSNIDGILRPIKQVNLNVPKYEQNSKYILTKPCYIWSKPDISKGKILNTNNSNITPYAYNHLKNKDGLAILDKGTIFDCLNVITDKHNTIWCEIISGWLPVYYKGDKRANWIKE